MTNGVNAVVYGVIPNILGQQSHSCTMRELVVIPCNTPRDEITSVVDKILAGRGLARVSGGSDINPSYLGSSIIIDALHQNDSDESGDVVSSKTFDEFSKSMSLPTLAEKAAATWGDL